jgi:hypothetical protein
MQWIGRGFPMDIALRDAAFLALLLPLALTTGCASTEVAGRFEAAASCPADRVTVKQVGHVGPKPIPPPPRDVAADPARLAVYERAQRASDLAAGHRIFVAEGCGVHHTYVCDYVGLEGNYCEPSD